MEISTGIFLKFPTYWRKYKFVSFQSDELCDQMKAIQIGLFQWFMVSVNLDNYHCLKSGYKSESQGTKNIQPRDPSWFNFILKELLLQVVHKTANGLWIHINCPLIPASISEVTVSLSMTSMINVHPSCSSQTHLNQPSLLSKSPFPSIYKSTKISWIY